MADELQSFTRCDAFVLTNDTGDMLGIYPVKLQVKEIIRELGHEPEFESHPWLFFTAEQGDEIVRAVNDAGLVTCHR